MVVVDALVGVAGDEQVVGAGRYRLSQETPLSGVQILGFVDDDVGEWFVGSTCEKVSCSISELKESGSICCVRDRS